MHLAGDDGIDSLDDHTSSQHHQAVVYRLDVVGAANLDGALLDDVARVNLVLEEESGDARGGVAVHHRPVDGCGAAVFGQQRGMQVERAQGRHLPHHLGQHPEGDDDEKVGIQRAQCGDKILILEVDRLQQRQRLLHGITLDVALYHVMSAPAYLVGHRHYAHDIISALYQPPQTLDGKVGRTEKHNL